MASGLREMKDDILAEFSLWGFLVCLKWKFSETQHGPQDINGKQESCLNLEIKFLCNSSWTQNFMGFEVLDLKGVN